jgi:hypothetical protein
MLVLEIMDLSKLPLIHDWVLITSPMTYIKPLSEISLNIKYFNAILEGNGVANQKSVELVNNLIFSLIKVS